MTDMKPSASVTADDVHRFMWSKRNSRGLVSSDQKELAEEFGVHHIKFHRLVKQLLEDGKLKVTAVGSRGMKTFRVFDPAPSFSIEEDELTSVRCQPCAEEGSW